jgi:protein TonB
MMRRFVLVSVALHASLAAALLIGGQRPLLFAAPEIQVTLAGNVAPPRTRPDNESVQDVEPIGTTPVMTSASTAPPLSSTASGSNPTPESAGRAGESPDDSDSRLVNNLLAELRSALAARFVYPPLARLHGWQGRVQLGLTIEADGHLSELRVLSSSGYAILDRDAIQTLARIGALPQSRLRLEGRSQRLELPVIYRLIES